MRTRIAWIAGCLILVVISLATLSFTRGQEKGPPSPQEAGKPTPNTQPDLASLVLDNLPPLQQQIQLSARRGADWLFRANGLQGRFVYGYLPALNLPMSGDHYLRQAGAAFALARAARFMGEQRYAARATQAVLVLLGETAIDAKEPQLRSTTLPSLVVNRLGAAGLLVLAINELPAPEADLLDQSEQLCNFIRRQQGTDGSLSCSPDGSAAKAADEDADAVNYYPGEALYALIRSNGVRPASWKVEVVRKALPYYQGWWRGHKNMAFVPWQSAAYAEAYLLTKESAFAQFVFEMNDWVCQLQYDQLDQRHPIWLGGFMSWADGKPVQTPPHVSAAAYAEGLAEACRLARQLGDEARFRRYSEALERCLQFLTTLQYTESNTTHYQPWYRGKLVGAFYPSEEDGNLRIDYTQHAVCAMMGYLTHVAKTQ